MDEMVRAVEGLKDVKEPAGDGIPVEVWKYWGANLSNRLHQWIIKIWEKGHVPQYLEDGKIVTIYEKGDRKECGNYRDISLLSSAGNIFARILLNRLSSHITPEVVPETQCGFRSNLSMVYMILCLRQLREKCIEQDRTLYIFFVDITKAFDTVWRTGLWQMLRKYGCPEKVQSHDRKSAYRNDGERQEWRGILEYICYNKQCQAGERIGSHAF